MKIGIYETLFDNSYKQWSMINLVVEEHAPRMPNMVKHIFIFLFETKKDKEHELMLYIHIHRYMCVFFFDSWTIIILHLLNWYNMGAGGVL